MCKFIPIHYDKELPFFSLRYIPQILACYNRFSKYLQDDFTGCTKDIIPKLLFSSFLYAVLSYDDTFMGFVFLDNFVGNNSVNYSAELTTCFEPKAWGVFTRYSAKIFLKKIFDEFGLYKIKVLVYPQNYRTKVLLKSSGFKYETTLKNETMCAGKPQDIDIYAIYRNYYYKNEVKNEKYNYNS